VLDLAVDKPTNVQVSSASSTSLRVTWDMTSDQSSASAVSYYRVLYYNVNDLMSTEMNVTVEEQSVIIRELCAFCEYNIRVVAHGVNGATVSSEQLIARTLSDGQFSPAYKVNIMYV